MVKKIILYTIFAGLIGVLLFGAVYRTQAKLNQESGSGEQRGQYTEVNGQHNGRGRNAGNNGEQSLDLSGEQDQNAQAGQGSGQGYRSGQGYNTEAEQSSGQGYRGGQGYGARGGQGNSQGSQSNQGYGAGNGQGTGYGQGRGAGQGNGTGQASVSEWVTLTGTVKSVDETIMIVATTSGQEISVTNRAWSFSQEQGFTIQTGDQVTLTGFYDGDTFEVGQITNETTSRFVQLRDENGRPLWAGRGGGG